MISLGLCCSPRSGRFEQAQLSVARHPNTPEREHTPHILQFTLRHLSPETILNFDEQRKIVGKVHRPKLLYFYVPHISWIFISMFKFHSNDLMLQYFKYVLFKEISILSSYLCVGPHIYIHYNIPVMRKCIIYMNAPVIDR